MKDYKELTMRLFERWSEGDYEARNKIVELNMPLAKMMVSKYKPYTDDQLQIAYIGLIIAVDTYKVDKGVPFANYACFIIQRELWKDYNARKETIEMRADFLYLDASATLENSDEVGNAELIADEQAEIILNKFIEDNELDFICTHIIQPSIAQVAERGKHMKTKIDFEEWKKLEFQYIMASIFEPSQKQRFNYTQFAKRCHVSVTNIRARHESVMDVLFQRMWDYMTLSFTELLTRLRGAKKIPHKLLCLDPGKTTGWAVFTDGELTDWGQVEDCYDNSNIDATKLYDLFAEVQPDFVLYEDYKVYSHKLDRHSFNPVFTVRLIGVIETYCQLESIKSHKQMATTAKNFCTDEKLKAWGFWQKGMRHSRDAIRHGCYFLLFYRKGLDIM